MKPQEPQAPPRPTPPSAVPASLDVHAALAALLAALAGRGMALLHAMAEQVAAPTERQAAWLDALARRAGAVGRA